MQTEIQKKYFRRAKLANFILQIAPFIRMIGLNGSLARNEARADSDIDFIIIVKPGRIWTCRAAALFLMIIAGLKRYPKKIAGRVCLNLFQTEDKLELTTKTEKLARSHSYTWLLWQESDQFQKFIQVNDWVKSFGYKFQKNKFNYNYLEFILLIFILLVRRIGEFVFDLFFNDWGERILSTYQKQRVLRDPRTKGARPGNIFVSEKELRFHPPKG